MSFSEILGRVLLEEGEESFLEFGAAENLGLLTEGSKVSHRTEHTRGGAANYGAAVVERFDGSGLVGDDGLPRAVKALAIRRTRMVSRPLVS
jgi:hypothetical protein